MNQKLFNLLPELLRRSQVVECGVPNDAINDLRVELTSGEAAVPFGKLGAVKLPGRGCKSKAKAKFKYRKADVAIICGYKAEP